MATIKEISIKQRRRGLAFADRIAELASEAFDEQTKRELFSVANSVRKRYGFSEAEKESVILGRIKVGAGTIEDLRRETGFTQPDIWRIVRSLEEGGSIKCQSFSNKGNGRPTVLLMMNDT